MVDRSPNVKTRRALAPASGTSGDTRKGETLPWTSPQSESGNRTQLTEIGADLGHC